MPVEVTDDLVRHVARLSRLALSDAELAGLHQHFRKILAYVSELQALDTEGIDPAHVATEASNVYREDAVGGSSLSIEDVLWNAPQATSPYFVVPRILEYGDSRDGLGPSAAAAPAPAAAAAAAASAAAAEPAQGSPGSPERPEGAPLEARPPGVGPPPGAAPLRGKGTA